MSNWAALRATLGGSNKDRRQPIVRGDDDDDARRGNPTTTKKQKHDRKRRKRSGVEVGKSATEKTSVQTRKDAGEDARGRLEDAVDEDVKDVSPLVTLDVDFRPGLLDDGPTTFVGDADAERDARARRSDASSERGGDAAMAVARVEAARLRFVTHMCMCFERACGARIGKRWCSSYEEWIATARETVLIPTSEASRAALADHEPHQALFVPDEDPLVFYRAILKFASLNLNPKGTIFFEINPLLINPLKLLIQQFDYTISERMDIFGKVRMLRLKKN